MLDVRVVRDKIGKSRSIAFVDVKSQSDAEACMNLNGKRLDGNILQIYISKPPSEGYVHIWFFKYLVMLMIEQFL